MAKSAEKAKIDKKMGAVVGVLDRLQGEADLEKARVNKLRKKGERLESFWKRIGKRRVHHIFDINKCGPGVMAYTLKNMRKLYPDLKFDMVGERNDNGARVTLDTKEKFSVHAGGPRMLLYVRYEGTKSTVDAMKKILKLGFETSTDFAHMADEGNRETSKSQDYDVTERVKFLANQKTKAALKRGEVYSNGQPIPLHKGGKAADKVVRKVAEKRVRELEKAAKAKAKKKGPDK